MSATLAPHPSSAALPRRKQLPFQTVQSDLLVHDPAAGQVHFLNPSAALIWESCDGVLTLAECAARLRSTFSIPEQVELGDDIRESLREFQQRGLLEE
ncbi:MAG: Coenzyme synthesis protein (PqqD) [Armatimonadetes bacterium]|nr:Coenzyme synthesis protein (PqqD) [Armatimonadota bacterium]